jgi:hypothetical protein
MRVPAMLHMLWKKKDIAQYMFQQKIAKCAILSSKFWM